MVPRILVCLAATLSCTISRAEERKLDSLKNSELVELLASKNPPPRMEEAHRATIVHYPKGYDHEKQRVVLAAANELRKRGVKAFPELLRAIDDQRYCCLKMGGEEEIRHLLTVGDMSWCIIQDQVDACLYAGIEYGDPIWYLPSMPWRDEKDKLTKWFQLRKNWTLGQFQKESVQLRQKEYGAAGGVDDNDPDRKVVLKQLAKINEHLNQDGSFFEWACKSFCVKPARMSIVG